MNNDPLLTFYELLDDPDATVSHRVYPNGKHEFKGRCDRGSFSILTQATDTETLQAAILAAFV